MASFTPDLAQRSPKLAKYLQNRFQLVQANGSVWNAFLKWSELPERIAVQAVAHKSGSGPIVGLTSAGRVNGVFRSKEPNYIWLHQRVAKLFEQNKPGSQRLVESTLLHELVHWGNFISQYGLDSRKLTTSKDSSGKVRGGYTKTASGLKEVGKAFEIEAYGRDINATNMNGAANPCGTCRS